MNGNEPSDSLGSEDCVQVRPDFDDTWNDLNCANPGYFVCENGKH